MHSIRWDDLQFILSVAGAGSAAGAARALGVNHSTVLRRIRGFEERHALRLFDRLPSGYALTEEGRELLATAQAVETAVTTLERRIAGRELRLEGRLRITSTDSLFASVLAAPLADFQALYPGVAVELAVTNSRLDLTRRDADVAIRPSRNPPDGLVGRRVAAMGFGVYAARSYLARRGASGAPESHRWLGVDALLAASPVGRWLEERAAGAEYPMRADTFIALTPACEAGLGLAWLPCVLGDAARLERVRPREWALSTPVWILTHEDLARSARVARFCDHMAEALRACRGALAGRV